MSQGSHSVGHRTPTSFILGIALWPLLTLFQCLHCRTMQFLSGRIAKTTQHGYVPLFCQIMPSERLSLFFFKFFSFYTIHHNLSFPSLILFSISTTSPLPKIHCFFISFQKRTCLSGISTEFSITSWNKTRHKLSFQG